MKSEDKKKHSKHLDRTLAILALVIIVAIWFIGAFRAEAELSSFLKQALPEAGHFERISSENYAVWKNPKKERLIGYVSTGTAHGYGGEMSMAVGVSPDGNVIGIAVIEHKETSSFFRRVLKRDFIKSLIGKAYSDPFALDQDVDGVTGATSSSRAVADAVRKASRRIATRNLGFSPIPEPSSQVQFGFPEAVLVALFAIGIVVRLRRFKYKKAARWISMLMGLAVLGFIYNKPLTIVIINKMLLGFWPEWQLHLYWYLLLAGILFVYTIDNKNPYCEWFCPFGSTQECLGVIGGAKVRVPDPYHTLLRWFQRALSLSVIVIALFYRNPGISSYEVFGAFFRLIGSNFQFVLLGIVLIVALFIRRPWCSYLCPLRPVTDFIRLIRQWIKELRLRVRPKRAS